MNELFQMTIAFLSKANARLTLLQASRMAGPILPAALTLAASLMGAAPTRAQSGDLPQNCPLDGVTVAGYSVTSAAEPERAMQAGFVEADVQSGAAGPEGKLRLYFRFEEEISSSCSLPIYIWLTQSPESANAHYSAQDPRWILEDILLNPEQHEVSNDGDRDVVLQLQTAPFSTDLGSVERKDYWVSVGRFGARHRFNLTRRSATLELASSVTRLVEGQTGELTARASI